MQNTRPTTPWWALRYEAMAEVDPELAAVPEARAEAEVEFLATLLNLPPSTSILDVGCGAGAHALLLQERGYRVTGLDLSPRLLRIARDNWERKHSNRPGPTWMPGDMRWPPRSGPYEAAILMGHVLGMFEDDAEHLRTLTSLVDLLHSPGKVVAVLYNPYFWAGKIQTRHFPPDALAPEIDVVRSWRFDAGRGRLEERMVTFSANERRELPGESLRCWTPMELVALFRAAGFRHVQVHGSEGWEVPDERLPVQAGESVFLWVEAEI